MLNYGTVSTQPVKRFFVDMLTRDIAVDEAILDLLDNCVDGILRDPFIDMNAERPYEGRWAKISVSINEFQIEDNCGGIPWDEHDRAFRMGRPSAANSVSVDNKLGVGVYGIGMKRAIFKMGSQALIWTQNGDHNYQIEILPEWMSAEDQWDLNVVPGEREGEDGTLIIVANLHDSVRELFRAEDFKDSLLGKIQSHYAVILQKGFRVEVNGVPAIPRPIQIRFATEDTEETVRPYVFRTQTDEGVDVFIAVGLREPILDSERVLEEQEGSSFSTEAAGWTVICNDRVVLYCNRDELTGWGTGNIPRYHTQFIAISGVVEFRGPPSKLPTTTTKRGLDYSARLYQQSLNRMRDGMSIFINFTNKWKTREGAAKSIVSPVPALTYSQLRDNAGTLRFSAARTGFQGEQYKPKLPLPPVDEVDVRISYTKKKELAWRLAEELLSDFDDLSSKEIRRRVGEASFEYAFRKLIEPPVSDDSDNNDE